jgi:hypothetical protein
MAKGAGFELGNYREVDERILRFYDRFPDGRIATLGIPQVVVIDGKSFIVAQAAAYRSPDDPRPCVGTAAEPFPGQTTYTRDSELMNAETSAWGRAIVAAGILAKNEGVASRNEVRNRLPEKKVATIEPPEAGTAPLGHTSTANSVEPQSPASPPWTGSVEKAKAAVKPLEAKGTCPVCGKALRTRKSQYGDFIGCSGYPDCRYVQK